jgi:hypothetical protein
MKIYTYFENINFQSQNELLSLWKRSWERQGFEALVLNRDAAEQHPYYHEFSLKMNDLHVKIMGKPLSNYGLSCYLRWLAYATQPEEKFYVSDYDIINNSFKIKEPSNQLHFIDGDCPCIASGTPSQFYNLCEAFIDVSYERLSFLTGVVSPHYHDQEFLRHNMISRLLPEAEKYLKKYNIFMTRDRTMLNGMIADLEKESDIANFQLVHFSHSFAYHKQKTHSEQDRTSLAIKISQDYFGL